MNEKQQPSSLKKESKGIYPDLGNLAVLSMFAGTVFSFLLFVSGIVCRSNWFLILSIFYAGLSFARSYCYPPVRKGKNTRSRILKGYQKYQIAGAVLLFFSCVVFLYSVLSRGGYYYPLPIAVLFILFLVGRLLLIILDFQEYQRYVGPAAAGLRMIDFGELILLLLFTVHLVMALTGRNRITPSGLRIPTAVVFGFLALSAGYMIWFAGEEIKTLRVKRRTAAASGSTRASE